MKLYDLTNGRYLEFDKEDYKIHIEDIVRRIQPPFLSNFQFLHNNDDDNLGSILETLINTTPIFIVESSMAGKIVEVPRRHFSVLVPKDNYCYSLDNHIESHRDCWAYPKELNRDYIEYNNDLYEREPQNLIINDLFGVYIHREKDELFPRRIFIWIDKIEEYAKENSDYAPFTHYAKILLDIVFFHEIGHALMDIGFYGERFSFLLETNYICTYIEEAFANCFALTIIFSKDCSKDGKGYQHKGHEMHILSDIEPLIKEFVTNQAPGYSDGWILYENYFSYLFMIDQWMCFKALINHNLLCILNDFWNNKDYNLLNFIKKTRYNEWLVIKVNDDKFGIIDRSSRKITHYFDRYDYDAYVRDL